MRATTESRRRRLRSLLERKDLPSQAAIASHLASEGFDVTQATISRDLDAIGATRVKADGGSVYRVDAEGASRDDRSSLYQAVDEFVMSITTSGHLIVFKVPPGAAQFVASRIDGADIEGVLGTIAGDDTILVIADDRLDPEQVARRIEGTE